MPPPPSNPRSSHCDCLLAEALWARLYSHFWTVFTRFFHIARSRNGPGSPEIMGIYGSNSRGVQKDRDLVTQPSFVETQRLPSSLVPGWNTGSPAPPPPLSGQLLCFFHLGSASPPPRTGALSKRSLLCGPGIFCEPLDQGIDPVALGLVAGSPSALSRYRYFP